jgi:hypothetical protein
LSAARLAAAGLALAAVLGAGLAPARAEEAPAGPRDFASLEKAFQADLAAKEPARRLRAFTLVRGASDLRVVDLVLSAAEKVGDEEDEVRRKQAKAQEELSKILSDVEKAQRDFERRPNAPTEAHMKAFNAKVGQLEKKRDAVYEKMRALDMDLVRARALSAAATAGLSGLLDGMGISVQGEALARVEAAWMAGSSLPAERLRFVDALAGAKGSAFSERLARISLDGAEDARVRVAALSARLARGDEALLSDAVGLLEQGAGPVQAAAIDVLRRLHRLQGIEPLIGFLAREDIGRLREDAHRALRSLTGEKHGPFAQPWRDWWTERRASFALPPRPADVADLARPEAGVTYHGITTFSDKILFVLDVSKSMEDPVDPRGRGPRAEEPKIAVAKRELLSAVAMLDPKKTFNLVFFGHDVVPYKNEMLPATPLEKERAKAFVADLAPSGGTNIHDTLEQAFRMAGWAADQKHYPSLVDTIFFLTDGKPTAGKVQDPERILETVAEWNRTARITIHCIGMGDHDPGFLERLATENGGKYVRR